MDAPQPDFGIVERTWEARLRERGLSPSRIDSGIFTGYEHLELYRQETQVAELKLDEPPSRTFIASLEVKIVVRPPSPLEPFEARDLITQFRQFLVVHPIGDADPKVTPELRARAAAAFPQRKKGWLSRFFGR